MEYENDNKYDAKDKEVMNYFTSKLTKEQIAKLIDPSAEFKSLTNGYKNSDKVWRRTALINSLDTTLAGN